MSLLQAYLQNPRTRQVLNRKPGEKGFSLIELVVVIAVLAVLTAIALPNFLGVSDDAAARSAQQAAVTAFKECQVFKARGQQDLETSDFQEASLNDFDVFAHTAGGDANPTGPADDGNEDCFTAPAQDGSGGGAIREIWATPKEENKFPSFWITTSGIRKCTSGTLGEGEESTTFNIGCSGTSGEEGVWK